MSDEQSCGCSATMMMNDNEMWPAPVSLSCRYPALLKAAEAVVAKTPTDEGYCGYCYSASLNHPHEPGCEWELLETEVKRAKEGK